MSSRVSYLVAVLLILVFSAVAAQEQRVAKLRVYENGEITLDGKAQTLAEISGQLKNLKESKGTVWYYRESGEAEPHPNAMSLVKLIIENRLPLSLSSKEDFSTVVLPDGTIKPR